MVIAKERGIKVTEKRTSEITDFANLICVELESETKKHFIMGTLFANKEKYGRALIQMKSGDRLRLIGKVQRVQGTYVFMVEEIRI